MNGGNAEKSGNPAARLLVNEACGRIVEVRMVEKEARQMRLERAFSRPRNFARNNSPARGISVRSSGRTPPRKSAGRGRSLGRKLAFIGRGGSGSASKPDTTACAPRCEA